MAGRAPNGRRAALVAAAVLAALAALAVLAPLVAPAGPDALDLARRRAAPSAAHPFGTDDLGRDVLTRVLFGARVSLAIGLVSAAVSGAIGLTVGAAAGYAGRAVDAALMRATDVLLVVPRLPLLMIAAAVLAPDTATLVLLVGAVGWMETARVVRAEVQSLRGREFVTAARALGAASGRVVARHVLPGALPTAAVATALAVGRAILLESALSFFGVGVQPPTASWGTMLYQAQAALRTEPWIALFPGAFVFVTVLCCNVVADSLAGRRS